MEEGGFSRRVQGDSMELEHFDRMRVLDLLRKAGGPVYEASLLRELTGMASLPADQAGLFRLHFSLYYLLYTMKSELAGEGLFLHLDPMRISLDDIPGTGLCAHFNAEKGRFCRRPTGGGTYCAVHSIVHRNNLRSVHYDPLLEFYSNPDNISFGESDLLRRLLDGFVIYAFRRGEIQESLSFFDLVNPTCAMVRKRYYELAKRYHPDVSGGDDMMKKLNRCYRVLREVFVI